MNQQYRLENRIADLYQYRANRVQPERHLNYPGHY